MEDQFYRLRRIVGAFQEKIFTATFWDKGNSRMRALELLKRNLNISGEEYKKAYDEWEEREGSRFDILMEHIMSYEWMRWAMTAFTESYMQDNYWSIVCEQILIKYLCVMHYSIYGEISWEIYQFITSLVSRTLTHGRDGTKKVLEELKEEEILSVGNLYLLI